MKELFSENTDERYTFYIFYATNYYKRHPMMKIRGAIILSCNKPFQLYLYCLETIMKIRLNSYFQFLDLVIDYVIYKSDLFNTFVKRGVSILRYFQKADVFTAIFYELKFGIDCNDI